MKDLFVLKFSHKYHLKITNLCIDAVGVDYVRLPSRGDGNGFRIRWQADQVDPRYIPTPTGNDPAFEITIINDDIAEPPGREYFEIDLTLNPTGSNRNGFFYPRAVGRVTIIDDDTRKFLYTMVHAAQL